jgi:AraC-like DNA-binding protein
MARHAARYLDTMLGPGQPGIRRKVQDLICVLLPSGRATAEAVARQMGLERRTLDRRLEREGTTFLSEMNEVRAQLCIQYLASEDRSLTAVADLLGFSGLSAFSRWYSGRFGAPPSTRRQNKAHAP